MTVAQQIKARYRFSNCGVSFYEYDSAKITGEEEEIYQGKFLGSVDDVQTFEFGEEVEVINSDVGGCLKRPAASEEGAVTSEVTMEFNSIPHFLYEVLTGVKTTIGSADATGNIGTLFNTEGTSVFDASTGVASVSLISGSEYLANFSTLTIVAVTATTVDVYADSRPDPIASSLSITTSGDADIADYGVRLTGGSGTIGMTIQDIAQVAIRPKNTEQNLFVQDDTKASPEVFVEVTGYTNGSNEQQSLVLRRAKSSGVGFNQNAKEFSKLNRTFTVLATPNGKPWLQRQIKRATS
jgi:hypothetical protein